MIENKETAYNHLGRFAGQWTTEGQVLPSANKAGIEVKGTDTYEWLPGGFFLLHKVDVKIGEEKVQTLEIIGFDESANHYTMQHYDNKGNAGLMTATLMDNLWIFRGESLLFKGGFSKEDTVFSGVWEQLNSEKVWVPYMNIRLVRASE
jgi:hypothetical protein